MKGAGGSILFHFNNGAPRSTQEILRVPVLVIVGNDTNAFKIKVRVIRTLSKIFPLSVGKSVYSGWTISVPGHLQFLGCS